MFGNGKITVKATYAIGNSERHETTVQVADATKGQVDQAIADQLGIDVRHVTDSRIRKV